MIFRSPVKRGTALSDWPEQLNAYGNPMKPWYHPAFEIYEFAWWRACHREQSGGVIDRAVAVLSLLIGTFGIVFCLASFVLLGTGRVWIVGAIMLPLTSWMAAGMVMGTRNYLRARNEQ